jgi:ATP-dependent exoDNAse (exonuclease V) beta subunit
MSNVMADQKQREQALRPDASFIVQAPAGSGKTELLIQRYLRLLALVDAPEEIIAITFTRKAAAEMQHRILSAIELAKVSNEPDKAHEQKTYALALAALKKNKKLNWQITENPGRCRIQTIDALCAALSRQMPVLSQLGAQPETLDDAEPLYEQAAINTLAELDSKESWSNDIAVLLSHLDNDLPRIKTLITDMLWKRDQWLEHVALSHDRDYLQQSLVNLIEDKLTAVAKIYPKEFEAELCTLLRYAAKHLADENSDSDVLHCQAIENLPGTTVDDIDQWQGISELLLTKTGTWRKRLNMTNGFPSPGDNLKESDERANMKTRIEGLISQLQDADGLHQQLQTIKQLPPASYTDQEWEVVNALCQLLKLAGAQLRILFAEKNQMDFSGITQAALAALGDEEAPTDLALHLDYQVKHLLVDEYQDISNTQHQLIKRLTAGWSTDDGRSLFLVGDPMQSIYRFREAEVGIFINTFHHERLGQVKLNPLRLAVNLRSQQGIVQWVNDSFATIFPEQDDVTTGAVSYSPSTATHTAIENPVTVYPLFNSARAQEAKQTVDIIKGLKQKDTTTAVLVRSRSHLFEIIPLLQKAGHHFRAIEIEGLGNQPAIQDILALTRAWLHPADRIAWLAVLRAPWCGLELKDLTTLFNDKTRSIWEGLQQQDLTLHHNPTTVKHVQNVITIFKHTFENKQRKTLRQTIESIWCQLGGPATLSTDNDLENITTYLDLLDTLDSGCDIDDLDRLLVEVSRLFATPDVHADDTLQVMTIHKAKGLEFDHVVLPGLGRVTRSSQSNLLLWMLRQRETDGQDLILASIKDAARKNHYTSSVTPVSKKIKMAKPVVNPVVVHCLTISGRL